MSDGSKENQENENVSSPNSDHPSEGSRCSSPENAEGISALEEEIDVGGEEGVPVSMMTHVPHSATEPALGNPTT